LLRRCRSPQRQGEPSNLIVNSPSPRKSPPARHHPRKRVIQYSRDASLDPRGRGVPDRPLSRAMTAVRYARSFSRHDMSEVCVVLALLEDRGRRESRMRAAPAVSCARCTANAHTSIQVQRRQSGLPCAMVLRFPSCSPWRPGFLATIASRNNPQDLTPASGRRDHTTSPSASRAVRQKRIRVHRIPPHVRDDREPPLVG
jgi:hypothetical protein